MDAWGNLHPLWQILIVGLLCGAGLPAVFALGLRAISMPAKPRATSTSGSDRIVGGNPIGVVLAVACFALVIAGVGWGIYFIVTGG